VVADPRSKPFAVIFVGIFAGAGHDLGKPIWRNHYAD
jgi:hypothetical protein